MSFLPAPADKLRQQACIFGMFLLFVVDTDKGALEEIEFSTFVNISPCHPPPFFFFLFKYMHLTF